MTSRNDEHGGAGPEKGRPDLESELDRTMAEAEAAVTALGHDEGDDDPAAARDAATRDAVEDALAERIAELEEELERSKGELETTKDRWLRAVADHENFKKRTKRETDETVLRKTQSLLTSFLPTVDNLERALEIATAGGEETPGLEQVLKGLQMVRDDFLAALKRQGIDPVDAVGVPFDPAVHDALQQIDSPDHAPGVVIREFEKGYRMGDRLLRPARVIVAGAGSGGGPGASEPES